MASYHSTLRGTHIKRLHRNSSLSHCPKTHQILLLHWRIHRGGQSETDDTIPLKDAVGSSPRWNTVSTPGDIFAMPSLPSMDAEDPKPTLREIFATVTSCNSSITALTDDLKGAKAEISFVRQDMQKSWERTSALEGQVSTIEDDMATLQRDVKYNGQLTAQHAA